MAFAKACQSEDFANCVTSHPGIIPVKGASKPLSQRSFS